ERKNISLFVAAFFLAGALGTLGASILTPLLATSIRFDRNAGTIKISRGRNSSATSIDLDNVVGIQLLDMGKISVARERLKVYQLNVIIQADPIERFHLLECGQQRKMQTLAKASADFLNIPLFEQDCPTKQQPEARSQGQ
ncbi:MAG: hypothetical protein KAS23_07530, partial [Anaerohalosphaera sp.]|nr:hypothetical protein [Anaerohalosphaera sp.]